jgi:murein DD-endopeptidase MepM/ murein hydrolase activator NlpD
MRSSPLLAAAAAAVVGAATGVAAVLVACAAAVASPLAVTAPGWARPVDGPVLRPFSLGPDRFAAGQHRGVDLDAPAGAGVRAACRGRVSFAGPVPRGGRTVSVRCGSLVATYQHLGAVAVRRGQTVARGARLGSVGHARPRPHVHLGVRVAATGAYLDPLNLLAGDSRREPPLVPALRRPSPLGPAPDPAARRPSPFGRAPVPAAFDAGRRLRPIARPRPRPAAPPPPSAVRLPWPVWLGLALVGLALPLGGIVTLRRRRHVAVSRLRTAA